MTEIQTEPLAPDLAEYRAQARAWLAAHLEPRSPGDPAGADPAHWTEDRDRRERALQRTLFDGGYAGIAWPRQYGGQGLTAAHQQAFDDEAQGFRVPEFGILGRTTWGICVPTMLAHAAPDFLARHVPRVLAGEELWVQFFSEPEAGSDLAGVRTRATRDGDRWILRGSKVWSSGAYYADYGLCLARTNWDVPKHRGLTWFAVQVDQPGITVQPLRQINERAEFCQEFLDDVEVAEDDVIGEVNQGWTVARTMLVMERQVGARTKLRPATGDRQSAADLVALARQAGRTADPHVQDLIARAHILDVVQAELGMRVADLAAAGARDPASLACYPKLAAGMYTPARAMMGVEIGGSSGLTWADGESQPQVVMDYLSARGQSIAGGTNEMMRNVISERVLGLPREPAVDTGRPFSEVVRQAGEWGRR
ncbi:MAG TPA: acyl-CoA dehydrogenase family protein [Streptosporangiaceae bacterium]|jgi:alkylation response protein AidB-like acyl-CoA dehydrogenase